MILSGGVALNSFDLIKGSTRLLELSCRPAPALNILKTALLSHNAVTAKTDAAGVIQPEPEPRLLHADVLPDKRRPAAPKDDLTPDGTNR